MRLWRQFLAAIFCVSASLAFAQSQDPTDPGFSETPAPIPQDHAPGASAAEGESETSQPGTVPEGVGSEVISAPEGAAAESAASVAVVPPGDWVTQPDNRPFELGMPYDMQSDGAFRTVSPIRMPAFHGLEPRLNLNYASLSRPINLESFLGDGWRIGGLSKIERTSTKGATPAYNNAVDILQLDGEELLLCKDGTADYPDAYKADKTSAAATRAASSSRSTTIS